MQKTNAEELLAQVQKSPAAVAIHDKNAWMSIFAKYHIVEDPVGSAPHIGGIYDAASGQRGYGALSRFFDTFIAPNQIAFDIKRDMICGNHVARDLTINIHMSDKVQAQVPMHLVYELMLEDEEWKIIRLAAYWELMPMIRQLIGKGFACVSVLSCLTVRMLRLQGVGGMLGFAKAAINIGNAGKKAVAQFVKSYNAKNLPDLMGTCANDDAMIQIPYGEKAIHPSLLISQFDGEMSISKVMAAGDAITATITLKQGDSVKEGMAIFEFNRKVGKISALRCYF